MIRRLVPWLTSALLLLSPALAETRSSDLPGPVQAALLDLQKALQLTPQQQVQFTRALAVTREVMPQMRANHQALLEATKAELDKEVPDLATLAAQRDDNVLADLALRQRARAEWLALYALLTPEQVAVLRDELKRRAEQMDALRAILPRAAASLI
ncbi:Spy/CpxP family protein refolding chaperone [Methyloversatilis sp.]|uniref:Spy/CpxP family protein refolding chaperone n=1 Tax=Methyloversatilis sp. TaxID=2569862 RepID=UPI0035B330A4